MADKSFTIIFFSFTIKLHLFQLLEHIWINAFISELIADYIDR